MADISRPQTDQAAVSDWHFSWTPDANDDQPPSGDLVIGAEAVGGPWDGDILILQGEYLTHPCLCGSYRRESLPPMGVTIYRWCPA